MGCQPLCHFERYDSVQELSQADFVIEAVSESERLKKSIFQQLDKVRLTCCLVYHEYVFDLWRASCC